MPLSRVAVVGVWALTLIGVVRRSSRSCPASQALAWLALALPLAVVAGIVGQLAVAEQRGFVVRLAATATGLPRAGAPRCGVAALVV